MGMLFVLCNGNVAIKRTVKLTKFVFRVLFQSSSSRTAALLQTMSSLPHKERILEKASIKIINNNNNNNNNNKVQHARCGMEGNYYMTKS